MDPNNQPHLSDLQVPKPTSLLSVYLQELVSNGFPRLFGAGDPLMAPTNTILGIPIDQIQLQLANSPMVHQMAYQQLQGSSTFPTAPLDPTFAPIAPNMLQQPTIPSIVSPATGFQYFLMERREARTSGQPIDPRDHKIVWKSLSKAQKDEYCRKAKKFRKDLKKLELEGKIKIEPAKKGNLSDPSEAPKPIFMNLEPIWRYHLQNQMDQATGIPEIFFATYGHNYFRTGRRMAREQWGISDGYTYSELSLISYHNGLLDEAWVKMTSEEQASVEYEYQMMKEKLVEMENEGKIKIGGTVTGEKKKKMMEDVE